MAGNVKEWTANAAGDRRYILGGAWDEPAYAFSIPDARAPFARDGTFGFRCVRRPTAPPERSFAPLTLRCRARQSDRSRWRRDLQSVLEPACLFQVESRCPGGARRPVTAVLATGNGDLPGGLRQRTGDRSSVSAQEHAASVPGGGDRWCGSTITDGLKRVEDFDYPLRVPGPIRAGRDHSCLSGTLERGPSPFRLARRSGAGAGAEMVDGSRPID